MRVKIEGLENLEVFYSSVEEQTEDTCFYDEIEGGPYGSGYFYWFCFPGCLPESDPCGPFKTESDAIENAQDLHI